MVGVSAGLPHSACALPRRHSYVWAPGGIPVETNVILTTPYGGCPPTARLITGAVDLGHLAEVVFAQGPHLKVSLCPLSYTVPVEGSCGAQPTLKERGLGASLP